eukprot:g3526.t1
MTVSGTVFGYFVAIFYRWVADTPWIRKTGVSEEEKRKADGCSKLFLVVMVLVSCVTLGKKGAELGKFAKSDENYCRHCIASNSTVPPPNPYNYTCRPGYTGNPAATPNRQFLCRNLPCNELYPASDQCFPGQEKIWQDVLLSYFIYDAILAVLQAPVLFLLARRDYRKQYPGGSVLRPLNTALQAEGLQPFDTSGAAGRRVALQFVAVERATGNPYRLCNSTYGDVSLSGAAENYKLFCGEVGGGEEQQRITMKHVCAVV